MGMDYAELPALSENTQTPIQTGMTFVVHAAYELPESGKMFVPLGDVCHVTADGAEKLMEFPRTPFVAGAGYAIIQMPLPASPRTPRSTLQHCPRTKPIRALHRNFFFIIQVWIVFCGP